MELTKTAESSKQIEPGVRGWLLMLVVWLGVIDPIYSAGLNMYVAAQTQANLDWGYIIVRAAMRIAAALALVSVRRPAAVWFALILLWLSGPAYVLVNWALFDNQVMPAALIRSTAVATACTLFLFRSERVRVTYGFGASRAQAVEAIATEAPLSQEELSHDSH